MKLLYITNGITGAGGLERVLSVKASLLAEQFGYEVHILSLNEKDKETFFEFSPKVIRHSIKVGGNPFRYMKSYKNGIQQRVKEINADVISVCDDALKGFFLPYLIRTNAKWIHESHASVYLGDQGAGVPFLKRAQHHMKQYLGKSFSKVVLLTEGNRNEWHLNNLVVIPNPAPFETYRFSDLKNKKVIAVGSYSFNKGYDLLLSIWETVEKDFPEWELHVYGKGSQRNLHQVVEKLQLKTIYFHDPVSDIGARYLESSIMVLPSRSEGFGMVLIEAMTFGVPCVAFDCPSGPGDIISDREDGFLIPALNTEVFENQLRRLMTDRSLRKSFGMNARNNSRRYAALEIVKQWDDLFTKLINR